MKKRCWLPGMLLVLASGLATAQQARVRVWEEQVRIPTYPLGAEDVNPHFYELEGSPIYPYTMQDNLTTERVERSYRAVFLENEYLKLMCLPEIGGRIQYVFDKRRGEPMFYHNRVIRPGLIALRGAWVSGGIEWNRGPQGHTVTSFSPVDVLGVENPDGSATLVIGNTEMNFRTGWEVRLTLHPGRSYLDESIRIFNPTDGFHPYYFWNNTAFPNRAGTRFIYPMSLGSDHDGKKFFTWPLHQGRDLSWLRNYPEPTSVFAQGCIYDFFGAYDVDRDYGIVQVANHHLLPGKKAWTWGQSDAGLASQSVLTDEDGPYIEVQSGPLLTQADFATLIPEQQVSWREFWYPVFDLGEGYEFATSEVAVERRVTDGTVELRFHATGAFPAAELRLTAGDEKIMERRLDLTPERTVGVATALAAEESFELSLRDRNGKLLLNYDSPLVIPETRVPEGKPAIETGSAQTVYLAGRAADRRMDPVRARSLYQEALDMDPGHSEALLALGVLELERGHNETASRLFDRAIERNGEMGLAWYFSGVSRLGLGDAEAALARGYQASKRPASRGLGLGLVGRSLMRLSRFEEAVEALDRARASDPDSVRLFEQSLIARLAAGRVAEATAAAEERIDAGTIRLVPHAVAALASGKSLEAFATEARRFIGEDEFSFIELGLAFAELGLLQEARALVAATLPDAGPLTWYTLAYWSWQMGESSRARDYWNRAVVSTSDYVFPSRPETIPALELAIVETERAEPHLYLGNLQAALGDWEEARRRWGEAARRDPDGSVAFRNLAMADWKLDGNLAGAAERFRRAIAARPTDQVLYRDLARVHLEAGEVGKAVILLEEMPDPGNRRADVTLLLARAYVAAGEYDRAIDLLDATVFSNREGDSGTWDVFSGAHIERGMLRLEHGDPQTALKDFETALSYPVNLNVGRPARHGRLARSIGRDGRSMPWGEKRKPVGLGSSVPPRTCSPTSKRPT